MRFYLSNYGFNTTKELKYIMPAKRISHITWTLTGKHGKMKRSLSRLTRAFLFVRLDTIFFLLVVLLAVVFQNTILQRWLHLQW